MFWQVDLVTEIQKFIILFDQQHKHKHKHNIMEEDQQQLKKGGRTISVKQDEYRTIIQYHIDGTVPAFEGKNMAQKKFRFISKAQMFVLNGSKKQGGGA